MMLTEIKLQIRGQLFRYSLVLIQYKSLEFQKKICVGGPKNLSKISWAKKNKISFFGSV